MMASVGFGLGLVLFGLSRSFVFSAAMLVVTGFAMIVQMASSNTLIQSMSPDELRGRVMSVYTMMFMGAGPFGALLAGSLADRIGAAYTVAGAGVICVIAGIVFGWRLPSLRGEARRLILAQQQQTDGTVPTG